MAIIIQDSRQNENARGADTGGIREISRADFPTLLREIPDPPARLFVRGHLTGECSRGGADTGAYAAGKFLCVVGSRKASQYGADVCRQLIAGLRGTDIVIVSGLALGIDAIAHQAALDAGLKTMAVLGSGLNWDCVYPRTNFELAKEIVAAGGALISEMPPSHKPRDFNFPERNRIMAGLSHATLIIEAEMKSGTLITARLALDYNRDVFTVPGSIFAKHSEGPHMLLTNGAMLVRSSEDILAGLDMKMADIEVSDTQNANTSGGNSKITVRKNILENCTPTEIKVYKALSEPMARANLLQKIQRTEKSSTRDLTIALSLLEMKGFVVESGGIIRQSD